MAQEGWAAQDDAKHGSVAKPPAVGATPALPHPDAKGKFDELVEAKGVRILIEPAALMHVLGTKMDFLEDKLKWVAAAPGVPMCVRLGAGGGAQLGGLRAPVRLGPAAD